MCWSHILDNNTILTGRHCSRRQPCLEPEWLTFPVQRPYWLDGFAEVPWEVPWEFPAVVSVLSALLHAQTQLKEPNPYQHALLLQASAQLASLPCDYAADLRQHC